jgi:HEPN domain-containing protein
MADSLDHRHWVEKAEEDIAAVRTLASEDKLGFGLIIVFHCQQAAEKFLKACLTRHRIDFPKTHDFETLLNLCQKISPSFQNLGQPASRLQPFAVQARYTFRDAAETTIDQAIVDMETVCTFCREFAGGGQASR